MHEGRKEVTFLSSTLPCNVYMYIIDSTLFTNKSPFDLRKRPKKAFQDTTRYLIILIPAISLQWYFLKAAFIAQKTLLGLDYYVG